MLEFPGGFNVYGSGKRIFGNRTTSKHWKHTVTIIMGLRASSSRLFLPHAPHTPNKVTAPISLGDVCVPQPTHTQTPDTRVDSSSTEACPLSLVPRSPRSRSSPYNGGWTQSLAHGVSRHCRSQKNQWGKFWSSAILWNIALSYDFFFFFWCGPFFKSLLNLLQYCFHFLFWFFGLKVYGSLAPQPGIKPTPLALEGEILRTGLPGRSLSYNFFF